MTLTCCDLKIILKKDLKSLFVSDLFFESICDDLSHKIGVDGMDEETNRKINTKDNVRVVTKDEFITAQLNLSLKARKLLYLAIAQCRMGDNEFYTYSIDTAEFAKMIGVLPRSVYRRASELSEELMKSFIKVKDDTGKKFTMYALFSMCKYSDGVLTFKMNADMSDLLLNLKKSFTQPFLADFLKMRSCYTISVWHLFQSKMESKIPGLTESIDFDVWVDELRQATGTEHKFKQIAKLKEKVLDMAIEEIAEKCLVVVTYSGIKSNRTIVGFRCSATSLFRLSDAEVKKYQKRFNARNRCVAANLKTE